MFTKRQTGALLKIPELKEWTINRGLSLDEVGVYYYKFFVRPITNYVDIKDAVLCDCAAGLGWLSFAFLLCGGKAAVLVEPNEVKYRIAQQIVEIVGVRDKCTFFDSLLQEIALPDKSIDVFASIETLEHVGLANIGECLKKINRLTRRLVIVTAPNRLFPIDSHDTRLPFAHWLPKPLRRTYISAFGKRDTDLNEYPVPWTLFKNLKDFRPISKALVFNNVDAWRRAYPLLIPYQRRGYRSRPPRSQDIMLSFLSQLLGRYSFVATWNLSSVWLAKNEPAVSHLATSSAGLDDPSSRLRGFAGPVCRSAAGSFMPTDAVGRSHRSRD